MPLQVKVVSESRVTWATCVPILVFLGLSVLELFPMYTTDRQTSETDGRRASSLNASALRGWGITTANTSRKYSQAARYSKLILHE